MPNRNRSRVVRRFLNLRSLQHLALRLNLPLHLLESVAEFLHLHYDQPRSYPKKDGSTGRRIDAPRQLLKRIQRRLNECLLDHLWLPDSIHAYRRGRSIRTASLPHAGHPFLLVADIREFYPSISYRRVYRMFVTLGCIPDVARLLTRLTTRAHRLPQGAPTSPALANLYIRLSGLRVNLKKTPPVAGPHQAHRVLGIILNSGGTHLDVPRSYRRRLEALMAYSRK